MALDPAIREIIDTLVKKYGPLKGFEVAHAAFMTMLIEIEETPGAVN